MHRLILLSAPQDNKWCGFFCICEVGTIGTYVCGGQGSRTRFSSDVDCSMKQEVQFVRMDKSNLNGFEAHRLKAVGSSPNNRDTAIRVPV